MFSAPFTIRQPKRPGLVTLGWPQFVALGLSLASIAAVVAAAIFPPYLYMAFHISEVRQYEREFGFEYGYVKGFPHEPAEGWLGFLRVTPDGAIHRAGIRSGDIVINQYGRDRQDLGDSLEAATNGKTICFFVVNPEEYREGEGRIACLEGKPWGGPINRN